MNQGQNFICPHCRSKLPFSYVLKIKTDHQFDCPSCGETLVPLKTKSFTWGYIIGFLAFVVPGQILLYLYDDIGLAFMVSTVSALTAILIISVYIYSNTRLTKPI